MDNLENTPKIGLEKLSKLEKVISELESHVKLIFQEEVTDANLKEPITQWKLDCIERLLTIPPALPVTNQYNILKQTFYLFKDVDELMQSMTLIQEKVYNAIG